METIIFIFFIIVAMLSFGIGMGKILSHLGEYKYIHSQIGSNYQIIGVKVDSFFTSYYIVREKKEWLHIVYWKVIRDNTKQKAPLRFREVKYAMRFLNGYSVYNK